jgi:hypothetical protein
MRGWIRGIEAVFDGVLGLMGSSAGLWRCWLTALSLTLILYFSFTKSKTKIAHTPTVIGNCTSTASRIGVPLGSMNVSPNIAKAVSIPRANLVFEFIVVYLPKLATSIILVKPEECNSSRPMGPVRENGVYPMLEVGVGVGRKFS